MSLLAAGTRLPASSLPYRGLPVTYQAQTTSPSGLVLACATLALLGCSGSREDVRVTLCKEMVAVRLGPSQPITWTSVEARANGYEHASVRLSYTAAGGGGEAVCYYRYNAVDDTALTLSDPLSAYSTSPDRMTLDGRPLSRSDLAKTIMEAMAKQGRALLDRATKGSG